MSDTQYAMQDCRTILSARFAVEEFSLRRIDAYRKGTQVFYPMNLSNDSTALDILRRAMEFDPR